MSTPEVLIEKDSELSKWHTMALAGTMKTPGPWSDKNQKEQKYVADYIRRCLEMFSNDIEVSDPHVWSTYGMTETLSHIALRRLNGDGASEWYTPFDSVDVSQNEDGCLVIDAPLVHVVLLNQTR